MAAVGPLAAGGGMGGPGCPAASAGAAMGGPSLAAARAAEATAMAQLQEERSRLALVRERVFVLHHELEHAGVALATYHAEFTEIRQRAAQLEALASEQRAEALRSVCRWAQQKAELRRKNAALVARNKALEQAVMDTEVAAALAAPDREAEAVTAVSTNDGSAGWLLIDPPDGLVASAVQVVGGGGASSSAAAAVGEAAGASVEVAAAPSRGGVGGASGSSSSAAAAQPPRPQRPPSLPQQQQQHQQRSALEAAELGRREHVEAEQTVAHRCRLEVEVGRLEQAQQRTRQLSLALSVAMAGGELPQPWLQEAMGALSPLLEDLSALHAPPEHAAALAAIQNELMVAQAALPDLIVKGQPLAAITATSGSCPSTPPPSGAAEAGQAMLRRRRASRGDAGPTIAPRVA